MKRCVFILLSIIAANAKAQIWPNFPYTGQWIRVKEIPSYVPDTYNWEVSGGVTNGELDALGLRDMGQHLRDYGYYEFTGDGIWDRGTGTVSPVFMWPPGIIENEPPIYIPQRNKFITSMSIESGFCNCDCVGGLIDTVFPTDGFGFCLNDTSAPPNEWGINSGYLLFSHHVVFWRKLPCPPSPAFWKGEDPLYFTDSTYNNILPEDALVSGDSPLYLKATTSPTNPPHLYLTLYIPASRNDSIATEMTYIPAKNEWHAKIKNGDTLGLKSFAPVIAVSHYGSIYESTHISINVGLPKIFTQVDSVLTDTVFINSGTMKVAKDLDVGLNFIRDAGNTLIPAKGYIDSAGYKYKSFWVANNNLQNPKAYYRQYPANPLIYKKWNKSTNKCEVTFNHDSLYAIGGGLTIDCKGALSRIDSIDNRFEAISDTLGASPIDTFATKLILIDTDPANSVFSDYLGTNQARAIAWQEGTGTINQLPNQHMNRWNNYWQRDVAHPNNTRTPCEGNWDVDAGILQINRNTWESHLNNSSLDNYPPGRWYAEWDSIEWNWQINITNGKWIFEQAMESVMTIKQKLFPDSCSYADCDSVPDTANREDLANYGYHNGETMMKRIISQDNWDVYINNPSNEDEVKRATYIKNVRRYKYRGNLW